MDCKGGKVAQQEMKVKSLRIEGEDTGGLHLKQKGKTDERGRKERVLTNQILH